MNVGGDLMHDGGHDDRKSGKDADTARCGPSVASACVDGLFQRLEQRTVDRLVASDEISAVEHVLSAGLVGHEAAGFADEQDAGADVPRRQLLFPETVHAA